MNGDSLDTDAKDATMTDRGAYLDSDQGLHLAPGQLSQFGFVFPASFTMSIWAHPIGSNSYKLMQKGTFLKILIDSNISDVHLVYEGSDDCYVNESSAGNTYLDKWGLFTVSHETFAGQQIVKLFYNSIPGTIHTSSGNPGDKASKKFFIGMANNSEYFRGFVYTLTIYSEIIDILDTTNGSLITYGTDSCVYPTGLSDCLSLITDRSKNSLEQPCDGCSPSCDKDSICMSCDSSCNSFCFAYSDPSKCIDMAALCFPGWYNSFNLTCEWTHTCTTNCAACFNSTACATCDTGYHLHIDKTCISDCQSGFVMENQVCVACHPDCAECEGTSSDDCTACSDANSSVSQTPGSCTCNSEFYPSETDPLSCSRCEYPCKECLSQSECVSCSDTQKLASNGSCVCPAGFYEAATCEQCHSDCATCEGSLSTQCTSCVDSYKYVNEGSCVCLDGLFMDESANCQACSTGCSSCDGPLLSDCNECGDNSSPDGSSCECEEGFYMSSSSICEPCDDSCKSCTSSEKCLECLDSRKGAIEGECKCEEGYCEVDGRCLSCEAIPLESELTNEGIAGAGSLAGGLGLAFLSMLTLEDPTVMWTIANTAQIICYSVLLDLPISEQFYQFLTSYLTIGFLPNLFLDLSNDSYAPKEYERFGYERKEYRDINFLKNSGRYIEMILLVLMAYLLMFLISFVLPENIKAKLRKITCGWVSAFIRIGLTVFLDLCVAGTVAIFGDNEESQVYLDQISILLCSLITSIPFLLFLFATVYKEQIRSKEIPVTNYIGSIYSRMNLDSPYCFYYEMFLSIRRLTYAVTIFFYRKEPVAVLIVQVCFSAFLVLYIVLGRVYKNKKDSVVNSLSEFLLCFTLSGLIFIKMAGESSIAEFLLMGINIFFILAASVSSFLIALFELLAKKKEEKKKKTVVVKINRDENDCEARNQVGRVHSEKYAQENSPLPSSSFINNTVLNHHLIINRKRLANNIIYIDNLDEEEIN